MSGLAVGADGIPGGWLAAWEAHGEVRLEAFLQLEHLVLTLRPALLGLDIPIGLPDAHLPGGRPCEREGRGLTRRASSFFSTVPRGVVEAAHPTYREALAAMRATHGAGLSAQSYAILPKMREADALARRLGQRRVVELHPEYAFYLLNGARPLGHGKHGPAGLAERRALLEAAFGPLPVLDGRPAKLGGAKMDDRLDAVAALWTARRVMAGTATRLPGREVPVDALGLRMEIWG